MQKREGRKAIRHKPFAKSMLFRRAMLESPKKMGFPLAAMCDRKNFIVSGKALKKWA